MSETRNDLTSLILDGSDAVCEGCGADPRTADYATVCFDWLMTIEWENDDDGIAHIQCPKCWTYPVMRSDGKSVEVTIPVDK